MRIIETTLRDGSYCIDFQFTAKDTAEIAKALEEYGIEYIEIGHGLGLNASNSDKGAAAATDVEYMQAAASVLRKAHWGMFFIPGIGRIEDIETAKSYGIGFIRIGTNITEMEDSKKYIEFAKKNGLFVFANFMKSYALKPPEFAGKAKLAQEFGADVVCLVDSAGGMLPDDVERYYNETQNVCDVKLGFHGHNNLHLATANTLKAIECGAYYVDSSLQGLGRSAGNAPTEVLILILKKRGLFQDLDINALMDFSEKVIKPLMQQKGVDSLSLTSGYAQFHSSYFSTIFKYAEKFRVDPRELIVKLCKENVVNTPEDLVEKLALEISYEKEKRPARKILNKQLLKLDSDMRPVTLEEEVNLIVKELRNLSKKLGKSSIFNIVTPLISKNKTVVSRFIQESFSFIVGSAEVASLSDLKLVLEKLDGVVDAILYDAEQKLQESGKMFSLTINMVQKSKLLVYRDTEVWVKAIDNLILEFCKGTKKKVLLAGKTKLASKLANALHEIGYKVYLFGIAIPGLDPRIEIINIYTLPATEMDVIVGLDPQSEMIDLDFTKFISERTIIIDGGIGTVAKDLVEYALTRGIMIIRIDMRGALDAEIKEKINTYELINSILGKRYIAGVECVAGGIYGRENSVVLDSISNPKYIVGLANGIGQVKYKLDETEREIIRRVERELFMA